MVFWAYQLVLRPIGQLAKNPLELSSCPTALTPAQCLKEWFRLCSELARCRAPGAGSCGVGEAPWVLGAAGLWDPPLWLSLRC